MAQYHSLVWKEFILNSGAETRQGLKREVGGETETAALPDATVELEPKYSTVTGQGEGGTAQSVVKGT